MRDAHFDQGLRNFKGQVETCENRTKGELKNPQGYWSVVVDVHILSYPKAVLSLNRTKYDQGSTAAAVET